MFNACGANKKEAHPAQIADMIHDHKLDFLAMSEKKMNANTPDVVRLDLAPWGMGSYMFIALAQ